MNQRGGHVVDGLACCAYLRHQPGIHRVDQVDPTAKRRVELAGSDLPGEDCQQLGRVLARRAIHAGRCVVCALN